MVIINIENEVDPYLQIVNVLVCAIQIVLGDTIKLQVIIS